MALPEPSELAQQLTQLAIPTDDIVVKVALHKRCRRTTAPSWSSGRARLGRSRRQFDQQIEFGIRGAAEPEPVNPQFALLG